MLVKKAGSNFHSNDGIIARRINNNDMGGPAMNKILYWSITVALAGLLFGFDTAVISGADAPLEALWGTSPLFHGLFVMSSALWGTVIGALGGSVPCDSLGRRKTLIIVGILYLVSALGSALATDPYTFSIFRFIGGLGVGASTIAVPAYISEISPAKQRGRLVILYQFLLVFGILVAYLSNYLVSLADWGSWRWMLGLEAVPAFIYLALVLRAPESPRWLLANKGDEAAARAVMQQMDFEDIETVITEIKQDVNADTNSALFSGHYNFQILLVFLLAFFNQLSGINFIIYFAPRVFELAGISASAALLSSAGVGLVNLCFTMLGIYLIDRVGRRSLMFIGSIGYIVSLVVVAIAFYAQLGGLVVVLFVFAFIASHAVGQGAVIWVFIAEVFPNKVRAKGQAIGCGTHWVFAALITLLMPTMVTLFAPHIIFSFFAFMMVLQLLYVIKLMPETKGQSLEALSGKLAS